MNSKLIKKNVLWAVIQQVVSIICGLIIPRLMLATFGSEANGLVTSINQFLNYVSLLEGGVSGVAVAALYKPLQEKDEGKVNSVVNAIQRYFVRLGFICAGFTLAVALAYPQLVSTEYDKTYIFFLVLVLGSRLIVQYCLSITYRLLLRADQKVFYVSIVQIVITLLHLILIWIGVKVSTSILFVYCISAVAYLIQPLFYLFYIRKHYHLQKVQNVDKDALKQKWDGFGQNLAYFIHTNTDVVLLTLFSTLTNVSIYSVYLMVAGAVNGIITTVSSAVAPSIGNLLAKGDREECNSAFEKYEFAIVLIAFFFYTCAFSLVVPFVSIYTKGITDANYIQPLFGIMLLAAELAYCIRDPYINVAYAAGHFKQTSKYAYVEAGINIALSIILVQIWDLTGVVVGTLFSMSLRAVLHILYLKKAILFISPNRFFAKIGSYILTTSVVVVISRIVIPERMESFVVWIMYALFAAVGTAIAYLAINLVFYREQVHYLINVFRKRENR